MWIFIIERFCDLRPPIHLISLKPFRSSGENVTDRVNYIEIGIMICVSIQVYISTADCEPFSFGGEFGFIFFDSSFSVNHLCL